MAKKIIITLISLALCITAVITLVLPQINLFETNTINAEEVPTIYIVGADVNEDGYLVFTMSDGSTQVAGYVRGDKGDTGATGAAGQTGQTGLVGETGQAGQDGKDGVDGKDGIDGKDGVNGIDGKDGIDGIDGKDGQDGKDGRDGLNGQDGKDGADGQDGRDGVDGQDGQDGKDGRGISNMYKLSTEENVDTYRIEFTDGTYFDLTITNGVDGKDGADGKDGKDGKNGLNGINGKDGEDGKDGNTPYIGENGNWWIGDEDTNIAATSYPSSNQVNIKDNTADTSDDYIIFTEYENNPDRNETFIDFALDTDGSYIAIITSDYDANISLSADMLSNNYDFTSFKNADNAWFVYDTTIDFSKVSEVRFEDGCNILSEVSCFQNVTDIYFSDAVTEIGNRCFDFANKISITNFYFEADNLPNLNTTALVIKDYIANVWVTETVRTTLGTYLQGHNVYTIGQEINQTLPNVTIDEYRLAAAEYGLTISEFLVNSCTNIVEQELLRAPYCSTEEFQEIKTFTLDLVKDCTTEDEKAKTIYTWIQSNILYTSKGSSNSSYETFLNKQGVCSQFAVLMHDMLSACDIYSFYVSGTTMSNFSNYTLSQVINWKHEVGIGNHAWLSVRIDGTWVYCDPTIAYKQTNLNKYAMTAENAALNWYDTPELIEGIIHCLPENYSASNLSSNNIILRDNKLYCSSAINATTAYTYNSISIKYTTYKKTGKKPVSLDAVNRYEVRAVITNATYYDDVYTASGRLLSKTEAMNYLATEFGIESNEAVFSYIK